MTRVTGPVTENLSFERDHSISTEYEALKSIIQWQMKIGDVSTMDIRLYLFDERVSFEFHSLNICV